MEQNRESQIRQTYLPFCLWWRRHWSGEKGLFRKRLSQLDVHMKPDPEGMHNYMQEKNNTISIRYSWRMFLWSWSRQKFFVKSYKKHQMYREKLASYVSIRLRNEFSKGHHLIKKKKINDQGLKMESNTYLHPKTLSW